MDLTVQEGAYGQHDRLGAEFQPHLGNGTDNAIVFHNQIFDRLLEDHQVWLVLQGSTYRLAIQHSVSLSSGGSYRRAFAGV
ncbi:Uncharacterised protein [Serratia quinivorans]|nr:Uncharacterised protein [Serratia quinivorans]